MHSSDECYLSEVYSAIQGEGPLVGVRQIFVRFAGCDLRCRWCDTPESLTKNDFCNVEVSPGKRKFTRVKNPISSAALINYINMLNPQNHHSLSLTGGEPLLQAKYMITFLSEIKNQIDLPIFLETGGHRADELYSVINLIDYISMDFKLHTSSATGDLWNRHIDF